MECDVRPIYRNENVRIAAGVAVGLVILSFFTDSAMCVVPIAVLSVGMLAYSVADDRYSLPDGTDRAVYGGGVSIAGAAFSVAHSAVWIGGSLSTAGLWFVLDGTTVVIYRKVCEEHEYISGTDVHLRDRRRPRGGYLAYDGAEGGIRHTPGLRTTGSGGTHKGRCHEKPKHHPYASVNTMRYIVYGMENITTRMDEDEIEILERLAEEMGVSRSDAVRIAVRGGAKEELIRIALQRYQEGEIGMRDAAELAGTTVSEVMAEANERGVLSNYEEADLESDVESLV